jgi:hypothetical protein
MSAIDIDPNVAETAESCRMALAGDAPADAARLIAINGLAAEGAARCADEAQVFARLRAVAAALDAARDIVKLAGGLTR